MSQLRRRLTDPSTFVCRIYDLLDELFTLYKWDACAAGAIAWLEKKQQLEDERKHDQDAAGTFIDDVLRCSKSKKPPKPPTDDKDGVDEVDPCRDVDHDGQHPEPKQPSPHGGGGEEGEPPHTGANSPSGQPPQTQQAAPIQQTPATGDGEPPSGGSTTAQS